MSPAKSLSNRALRGDGPALRGGPEAAEPSPRGGGGQQEASVDPQGGGAEQTLAAGAVWGPDDSSCRVAAVRTGASWKENTHPTPGFLVQRLNPGIC